MAFFKFILVLSLGFWAGFSFAESQLHSKEAIEKDLQEGIEKLKEELSSLQIKAEKATGKVKSEIDQKISELKKEEVELTQQAQRVKSASGKAWLDIKKGATAALESMKKSIKDAKERFKE